MSVCLPVLHSKIDGELLFPCRLSKQLSLRSPANPNWSDFRSWSPLFAKHPPQTECPWSRDPFGLTSVAFWSLSHCQLQKWWFQTWECRAFGSDVQVHLPQWFCCRVPWEVLELQYHSVPCTRSSDKEQALFQPWGLRCWCPASLCHQVRISMSIIDISHQPSYIYIIYYIIII